MTEQEDFIAGILAEPTEHKIGDTVEVAGATFTKVSDNPFPSLTPAQTPEQAASPVVSQPDIDDALAKMLDSIVSPEEYGQKRGKKGTIYGPPGHGKTVFCCSSKLQTYLLAVEPGAVVLKKHPECKNVKVVDCVDSPNPVAKAEAFIQMVKDGKFPDCEVLVVDTYTSLRERDLELILRINGIGTTQILDNNAPEYRPNTNNMKRIGTALSDLSCHVIIICHSQEVKSSGGGVYTKPVLTDAVAQSILGKHDFMGYYEAKGEGVERNFRLTINPVEHLMSKNRLSLDQISYVNPTVDLILEA